MKEKTLKLLKELKLKTFIERFKKSEEKAIKEEWSYQSFLIELLVLKTDSRRENRVSRLLIPIT